MKKIFIFVLVFILCASSALAEQYKLCSIGNLEDNQFFLHMEQKFGISYQFHEFQNKNEILENNDTFDVLLNTNLTSVELEKLYSEGKIADLGPFIEKHMPNLHALIKKNPSLYVQMLSNGKLLSLPNINLQPIQNYIWINKAWLNKLNLSKPDNSAELLDVLKAFKNNDPNGNGLKDEIPLHFHGIWDLKFLAHGFGIVANDFHFQLQDSQLQFVANENAYYDFLIYLRDLYQNSYLDKAGFQPVLKLTQSKEPTENIYGIIIAPNIMGKLPKNLATEYEILDPLQYNGKQIYRKVIQEVSPGALVISSTTKNISEVLSCFDYLYGEEGAIRASIGEKGTTYQSYEDGTWDWIESDSQKLKEQLLNSTLTKISFPPLLEPVNFHKQFDDSLAQTILKQFENFSAYLISPTPPIKLSQEELEYIQPIHANLSTCIDENSVQFILGEKSLNSTTWEAYKAELQTLQLDDYLVFWKNKFTLQGE